MKIFIPKHIENIITTLNENGFEAYLVGGCVRDSLLGLTPHDFDITTNALPHMHKSIFPSYKVLETGIKHGTVTILTEGGAVEITTFRTEGEYKDNRRPSEVFFTTSLEEDLSRRDFTVNALAYHPDEGIIDLFGGINDLENGIIRTVGDAQKRFSEDALRILRAIRFCSVLGFHAEKETAQKAVELQNLLENISRERILVELKKLISGKACDEIISLFPSVINTALLLKVLSLKTLSFKRKLNNLPMLCDVRFAALLSELDSQDARKVMQGLKSEKVLSVSVEALSEDIGFSYNSIIELKKFISEKGYSHAEKLALLKSDSSFLKDVLSLKEENPCLFIKDLAVSGKDLQNLGIKDEEIGKTLKNLLSLVIEEKLPNDKASLLSFC